MPSKPVEPQNDKPAGRGPGVSGRLASSLNIELHSHYAILIWEGRPQRQRQGMSKEKVRPSIMSMPQAIRLAGNVYQASAADNPYADEMMCRLEVAIDKASVKIREAVQWVEQQMAALPASVSVTEVKAESPLNIGVFSRSPLGYRCVWLLVGYDELAMKVFQAWHYGLISRQRRDELLSHGGHLIRKIYGILRPWRPLSVTRRDIEEKTPEGKKAIGRLGEPDPDIMSGKRRSSFSPPLQKRSR
ncbi:TPA: TIGR03761 family integrating conjugative element protein [Klebsiella oxytoca]|uniref:TIGR03761 family integrating conjugative element protein n=1 Tax=Klebsiella oxytoca TaxID=571 RepID=A0AAN5RFK3_KLEOX|nr:TIGR03761 family integrating conjugative element protein [Klebsiella oxytoca]